MRAVCSVSIIIWTSSKGVGTKIIIRRKKKSFFFFRRRKLDLRYWPRGFIIFIHRRIVVIIVVVVVGVAAYLVGRKMVCRPVAVADIIIGVPSCTNWLLKIISR